MTFAYLLNCSASLLVFFSIIYACHSPHVHDGILVKKGLAALAIGMLANAFYPSMHTLIWISCSVAALVIFIAIRCFQAKMRNMRPDFIS